MNEKKYNALDSALQEITSSAIRLSEKDKKCYNDHLKQVLECIVKQMKNNDVFKFLYKNNVYTGSFYENLRISKPDEFDINLIFVLPAECKIFYDQKQPGFVKIKVISFAESQIKKHLNDVPNLERILKSWIDPKTKFLLRTGFMQWMQGVFTQALDRVSLENTVIKRSSSGPAFTVKVSQPQLGLSEYSVDLVPVFEFPDKDLPSAPVRKLPKGAVHKEWTVVPKSPPNVSDVTYWRMSFYKQEKEIMNNLNGMKHVIKLIKLFRDKEKWKVLSSYAIKTVFLWECERQPKDGFWQNGVGQLFVHMLRRLHEHLMKQSIPFYWDKNHNLLSQVNPDTLTIYSNRISVVLKKIDLHLEDDPELIKNILGIQKDTPEDNKYNLNSNLFKEINNQQPTAIKTSSKTPCDVTRIHGSTSWIDITEKGISSVKIGSNVDENVLSKTKLRESVDVAGHLKIGCKNNAIHQTTKISDPVLDLPGNLKEQHDIKQTLQFLLQQQIQIKKEIKELKKENALLRKHFHNTTNYAPDPQASSAVHTFFDLPSSNQNCHLCGTLLPNRYPAPEEKQVVTRNATGQNSCVPDTIKCNSYMVDLFDVFNNKPQEDTKALNNLL
ncbi:hypothetical protein R5R35_012046 [Gryllus longicercus]|uniref:Uncharacterized protein n=2 Tax=Gryllus longicercus TaxID=2509291 RepID=A0AAN9VNF5_9ORTH